MSDPTKLLGAATRAIGGLAGLAVALYVLGGSILAAQLTLKGLAGSAVVGALPRELLISFALSQIVAPALFFAVIAAAVLVAWRAALEFIGGANLVGGARTPMPPRPRLRIAFQALLVVGGAAVLAAPFVRIGTRPAILAVVIGGSLAVLTLGVALGAELVERLRETERKGRARGFEVANIILIALLVALVVAPMRASLNIVGAPLVPATVCMTDPAKPGSPFARVKTGFYIGAASDAVYIGETASQQRGSSPAALAPRLSIIPWSHVQKIYVGPPTKLLGAPGRPPPRIGTCANVDPVGAVGDRPPAGAELTGQLAN